MKRDDVPNPILDALGDEYIWHDTFRLGAVILLVILAAPLLTAAWTWATKQHCRA